MSDKPPILDISTNVVNNPTNREYKATIVKNFAAAIREEAERQRFTATSLGKALEIPSSTMANYWSGKRPWPMESIPALSNELGLSATRVFEKAALGINHSSLIGQTSSHDTQDNDLIELDQIDLKYGMGGTYTDGPVEVEKRAFSHEWLQSITSTHPRHLFWATGDGDSMEPTIRSGEIVLIDRSQESPRIDDAIWAVVDGEIGMIKRMRHHSDGTVELLSDNPLVPPRRTADGELHVIGRVIAVVRRI